MRFARLIAARGRRHGGGRGRAVRAGRPRLPGRSARRIVVDPRADRTVEVFQMGGSRLGVGGPRCRPGRRVAREAGRDASGAVVEEVRQRQRRRQSRPQVGRRHRPASTASACAARGSSIVSSEETPAGRTVKLAVQRAARRSTLTSRPRRRRPSFQLPAVRGPRAPGSQVPIAAGAAAMGAGFQAPVPGHGRSTSTADAPRAAAARPAWRAGLRAVRPARRVLRRQGRRARLRGERRVARGQGRA